MGLPGREPGLGGHRRLQTGVPPSAAPERTGRKGPPDPDVAHRQSPQPWAAPHPPRTVRPGCGAERQRVPGHPLHTQLSLPSRVTHRASHWSPPCEPCALHLHLTRRGVPGAAQGWLCCRLSGNTEDTRAEEMSPGSRGRPGACTLRTRPERLLRPPAPLLATGRPQTVPGSRQARLWPQCHRRTWARGWWKYPDPGMRGYHDGIILTSRGEKLRMNSWSVWGLRTPLSGRTEKAVSLSGWYLRLSML